MGRLLQQSSLSRSHRQCHTVWQVSWSGSGNPEKPDEDQKSTHRERRKINKMIMLESLSNEIN